MSRGSIGGVTVGNAWMRNNPDIAYPENHEDMDDETLLAAITTKQPTGYDDEWFEDE